MIDHAALDRTIATMAARLLERRNEAGYWEGRLASSALATATAVLALRLAGDTAGPDSERLARAGTNWLDTNQNEDGGWGDTAPSRSNLSTTALCWAALNRDLGSGIRDSGALEGGATGHVRDGVHSRVVERAEAWLRTQVGGLEPARLRRAIVERYGKDRTFSIPILTALTLAGRLGEGAAAWREVPQLPFELVALPHQLFQWLRLPVVSYALPALIAIGQARHHHAPTPNPVLRPVRQALRGPTLETLGRMQPATGGYLEAIPLTAFVVMSLAGSGRTRHSVVRDGVRFLAASARPDGSWPIDTNLATWVTTLSVNTLAPYGFLEERDRGPIADWLLGQQLRAEHPFTHAAPGGWAWTDLPGGVPDADDTSGALLALANSRGREFFPVATTEYAERSRLSGKDSRPLADAASAGVRWLLDLQNSDGGISTFCRGWGALPFDRSAPEITAHALQAWSAWLPSLTPELGARVEAAAARAVRYLAAQQAGDGTWLPLWFGNEHAPGEANPTYATARITIALANDLVAGTPHAALARSGGLDWLLGAQNADGGWGGGAGAPSSIEETGLALHAVAHGGLARDDTRWRAALARGIEWLIVAAGEGRRTPASPIGLYFARLWYFEELYPLIFGLGGLLEARRALGTTT